MALTYKHLYLAPYRDQLPAPITFRTATVQADAAYPQHTHAWGEFVYSYSGVMEVRVGNRQYLVPSQYGLWLPPATEHQGLNRYEASHCSMYVDAALCGGMPTTTCALTVTPLVRALLEHLRQHPPAPNEREADQRLLQVLLDQLTTLASSGSYLPTSTDSLLAGVLEQLERAPGDTRSLAAIARAAHTTERTLMRRCQRDLGMPLAEWRQRLRVIHAMPRLEAGEKVESIALDLGYGSASAFIAMFRRLMGQTPDEYRRTARERR